MINRTENAGIYNQHSRLITLRLSDGERILS